MKWDGGCWGVWVKEEGMRAKEVTMMVMMIDDDDVMTMLVVKATKQSMSNYCNVIESRSHVHLYICFDHLIAKKGAYQSLWWVRRRRQYGEDIRRAPPPSHCAPLISSGSIRPKQLWHLTTKIEQIPLQYVHIFWSCKCSLYPPRSIVIVGLYKPPGRIPLWISYWQSYSVLGVGCGCGCI